eukprot:gene9721-11521_t
MDPTDAGNQPFVKPDVAVVANGEIYNFRALYDTLPEPVETQSDSDSEVLMHLYRAFGADFVPQLDGMFAFVLVDQEKGTFLAARDHVGIKPLYLGRSKGPNGGKLMFASELKCLVDVCDEIEEFPSGTYYTPETGYVKFYNPDFMAEDYTHNPEVTPKLLRDELEKAVVKRMMSDVEFGLFLSGGIDSCIVGTLMRPHVPSSKRLPSFCVGMKDSPDITAAREIAKTLGYDHSERIFTADEACSIIDKVIYHLETYNTELIRSSIPNYFLAEHASQQVKMCLTGEGSDELFGGYVYFSDAPNKQQFQGELNRIYGALGGVNLKRADRMTMAHGLEARVPFLDVKFTALAMSLDPENKMIGEGRYEREKAYLRKMFKGEIPEEILWRQKAMQCEGVGEGWVARLQRYCEARVSDEAMSLAAQRFPHDTPITKEEYYYRDIFESYYPSLDRFTFTWPGGCRAGGAPWENTRYTREGLINVADLSHGLQENSFKDSMSATKAASAAPAAFTSVSSNSVFSGKKQLHNSSLRTARSTMTKASTVALDLEADSLFPEPSPDQEAALSELLLSGGDDRTFLDPVTQRNSYHVGPFTLPGALVRSSCTCNPLTNLASAVAHNWYQRVSEANPEEFTQLMEDTVRGSIMRGLELPEGAGVVTAPSGTDVELVPVMIAKALFPEAKQVRVMVAAMNEIGKGVALAAGGQHSSNVAPLSDESILRGRHVEELLNKEDVSTSIKVTELDARDSEGRYVDHSETIAKEVAEARAVGEPTVVHTVYGTKTNKREPFPEGTGCGDAEASTFVVVDACQGRYSRAEIAELLDRGAVITITGSKAWSGPPFSGAILIPPMLMERLQRLTAEALWVPDMVHHYFTQDDFPASLPAFRARLPALQNRGLAMRWIAALAEFEAYLEAGGDSDQARVRVADWAEAVTTEIEQNHPQVRVFEVNDSIINIRVDSATGEPLAVPQLRNVYALLTQDITSMLSVVGATLTEQEAEAAQTVCLIGQPVKICEEFGIIRLALGCPDIRMLMEDMCTRPAVHIDSQILRKISL